MISKPIMAIIIFIGILLITIAIVKNEQQCPQQQIIYRYIPRTFDEEQAEPVYASDIFRTMFEQQSPWVASITDLSARKREAVNNYFISQY